MNADFFEQVERLLPNAYIAFSIAFTGYEISVYDNGYTEDPPPYYLHSIDTGDLPAALDELIAQITAAQIAQASVEDLTEMIDKAWPRLHVGCYYLGTKWWESEAVFKSWNVNENRLEIKDIARCRGESLQASLVELYAQLKRWDEQS